MPTAWRIVKASRATAAFDGEGARLNGGRWNSPGVSVVYLAQSQALAALEMLVHLHTSQLLAAYCSIPAAFDDAHVETVDPATLPVGWTGSPAPAALQKVGDLWVAQRRSVVLKHPSAIVPSEWNFLLNPLHPRFGEVAIGEARPFKFDRRLK